MTLLNKLKQAWTYRTGKHKELEEIKRAWQSGEIEDLTKKDLYEFVLSEIGDLPVKSTQFNQWLGTKG